MKKALIGNGGHAREVIFQIGEKLDCFVSDEYSDYGTIPLSKFDPDKYEVMIAVGKSNERYEILKKLPKTTKFFNFIHPTAIVSDDLKLGHGCFIGAYSIITVNISIGNHCILNRSNHIGHDSSIGDFCSMMPCSIISGNCKIGNRVYFGTNSSVRQKINICDDVVIGLNSGVVKHITESGVYVGVPAKKIK